MVLRLYDYFWNEYLVMTILDLCYHASLIGHLPFYF